MSDPLLRLSGLEPFVLTKDIPFVNVGDAVSNESVVCIVEAMKVFNEIKAETKGTIAKVLIENGQAVEFGQPMFLIKPN